MHAVLRPVRAAPALAMVVTLGGVVFSKPVEPACKAGDAPATRERRSLLNQCRSW
jgi:hypothetical protein